MRIFLTGASGYIGRHVVERLLQEELELVCLVPPSEAQHSLPHLHHARITVVPGDILWEPEQLAQLMQGCTHLVHLAGLYTFFATSKQFHDINVRGTAHVAQAALIAGLRTIHISSCTAFGRQAQEFHEEMPVGPPLSAYARTKALGDQAVRRLRQQGLRATILFPASVLGRGDNKVSGLFFHSVAERPWLMGGNGLPMLPLRNRIMTWVHVQDVADAIWGALMSHEAEGRDYLVGGHPHSFGEIHDMIAQVRLGLSRHPRLYFPFDRLLLVAAWILEPIGRRIHFPPPWGLTRDQIRTMLHGIRFRGERARAELLGGRPYRPIPEAIKAFFEGET